jgi:hypothetical protein
MQTVKNILMWAGLFILFVAAAGEPLQGTTWMDALKLGCIGVAIAGIGYLIPNRRNCDEYVPQRYLNQRLR